MPELKPKSEYIKSYIAVIYLILMSGTFLQRLYMDTFQKINIVLMLLLIAYKVLKKDGSLRYVPRNIVSLFVAAAIIGTFINMFYWGDYGSIWGYVANISLVLMPFLLISEVDFDLFKESFIKVIVLIAAVSLVFFYIPALPDALPNIRFTERTVAGGYQWYVLYAKFINTNNIWYSRNIGIFWEPGMYQGYLIFGMLLICMRKIRKRDIISLILLVLAVISTGSTTGYILLLMMILIFINRLLSRQSQAFRYTVVIILLVGILVLFNFSSNDILLSLLPSEAAQKLTDTGNASRNTRLYNILSDAQLAFKNPFGIANSQIDTVRELSMRQYSSDVDSSVTNSTMSMLLTYGMIPGILYFALNVFSCFKLDKDKLFCLIVFAIMIITVNTEPHYLCLFFTFIFYEWAIMSKESAENINGDE